MDETWALGLSGLGPQDISRGLMACLDRTDPWPPTLPEFRALCKPEPKPAYHEIYQSLPAPELTKEQKLEHIAKIRQALK